MALVTRRSTRLYSRSRKHAPRGSCAAPISQPGSPRSLRRATRTTSASAAAAKKDKAAATADWITAVRNTTAPAVQASKPNEARISLRVSALRASRGQSPTGGGER